jgi:hypothetical protein
LNSYNGFTPEQRMEALRWTKAEYAAGRRAPPRQCCVCGQTKGIIEPHSEDYSKPYGEHIGKYPLCYVCHMILHCRFRAPDAFRVYQNQMRQGLQFPAYHTRAWERFVKEYLEQKASQLPRLLVRASGPTFLDTLSMIRR